MPTRVSMKELEDKKFENYSISNNDEYHLCPKETKRRPVKRRRCREFCILTNASFFLSPVIDSPNQRPTQVVQKIAHECKNNEQG